MLFVVLNDEFQNRNEPDEFFDFFSCPLHQLPPALAGGNKFQFKFNGFSQIPVQFFG